MKKISLAVVLVMFCAVCAFADILPDKIFGVAHYSIDKSTIKQQKEVTVYALEDTVLDDALEVQKGEKMSIILNKYNAPKRGKRNGYYDITLAGIGERNITSSYALTGTMRVSTPADLKGLAKKAGVTVVGQILQVPGFSQAVAAAKGLISPNPNQSRLESAGENLYKSTPLTYVEKGTDFSIEPDGVVVLKLKNKAK